MGASVDRVKELDAQLDELERELAMRRKWYPKWVEDGRMTQVAADRQMKRMQDAKETVRQARVLAMMGGVNGQPIEDPDRLGAKSR